jgi:nucleotide-binding universal stress UspA family protein
MPVHDISRSTGTQDDFVPDAVGISRSPRRAAAVAESAQAAEPDHVVVIEVGSSSSAMHRMVGLVAVNLARHSPAPVTIVP